MFMFKYLDGDNAVFLADDNAIYYIIYAYQMKGLELNNISVIGDSPKLLVKFKNTNNYSFIKNEWYYLHLGDKLDDINIVWGYNEYVAEWVRFDEFSKIKKATIVNIYGYLPKLPNIIHNYTYYKDQMFEDQTKIWSDYIDYVNNYDIMNVSFNDCESDNECEFNEYFNFDDEFEINDLNNSIMSLAISGY